MGNEAPSGDIEAKKQPSNSYEGVNKLKELIQRYQEGQLRSKDPVTGRNETLSPSNHSDSISAREKFPIPGENARELLKKALKIAAEKRKALGDTIPLPGKESQDSIASKREVHLDAPIPGTNTYLTSSDPVKKRKLDTYSSAHGESEVDRGKQDRSSTRKISPETNNKK